MSNLISDGAIERPVVRTGRWRRGITALRNLTDTRLAMILVLTLLGIYVATMGGHTYAIDDEGYLAGAKALIHHTTVMQPNPDIADTIFLVRHKNGLQTIMSPIGTLALFAPGVVAGKLFSLGFSGASREEAQRLVYLSTNSVLTAATAGLLFLLTRRLRASRRVGLLLTIAFSLGSWAWPHSKTGFSEPGTALMLTATLLLLVRHWHRPTRWSPFWVGLLAGCVGLTRSSTLMFVPIFGLMCIIGLGRSDFLRSARVLAVFSLGGMAPAVAFCANSWLRFGSFFDPGYPPIAYSTPAAEGLFGLFLSPGKGLFWYAPISIAILFGLRLSFIAQRRYAVTVMLILAVHVSIYSRFSVWSGEAAFGPRYMLPLLPMLIALLSPVIDQGLQWWRGALVTTAIGIAIPGILGGSMYFNAVYSRNAAKVSGDIHLKNPDNEQVFMAWQFYPRSSQLALYVQSVPLLIKTVSSRMAGHDDGMGPLVPEYQTRIFWYNNGIQPDYWWAWWSRRHDNPLAYVLLAVPGLLWGAAWQLCRRGQPRVRQAQMRDVAEPRTSIAG
jgi:hypothetical protein